MNLDPKVQRIIAWRESIATLSDERFFELMRMYLGEIKTPFNKQKLIEELGAFIRREENKRALVTLLDEDDLRIIAAILHIPSLTPQKLEQFLNGMFPLASLYERIANLEERLIVFICTEERSQKKVLCVNPLLEEVLAPLATLSMLIPAAVPVQQYESAPAFLSPAVLASFFSYIMVHPDIIKADGALKKKNVAELESVFGNVSSLPLLFASFCNLGLVREAEKCWSVDWPQVRSFAELPDYMQYGYLCAAAAGHFSRGVMHSNAQLLQDVLESMQERPYERSGMLSIAFLLREKAGAGDGESRGRFARMLARAGSGPFAAGTSAGMTDGPSPGAPFGADSGIMECMIDACLSFGVLYVSGKTDDGKEMFCVSPSYREAFVRKTRIQKKSLLSIDAGFSITVLPGLTLLEFLPLIQFLSIIRCDTAATFEITRQSVMRAFDREFTPQKILDALKDYASYDLPQNLVISIQDWYRTYTSAALFKGYVLKVDAETAVYAEKNPSLACHIRQVLAPGVFLLDFATDEEAQAAVKKSGLDFIGSIREEKTGRSAAGILLLREGTHQLMLAQESSAAVSPRPEREALLDSMKDALDDMKLSPEQKEGLLDRIQRRVIVNVQQLRGESVRFEKIEAGGMDYTGKLHVIDSVIQSKGMLEVEQEGDAEPLVGTPLLLTKKENDADLEISLVPDGRHMVISVAQAVRIKKIRGIHPF